LDRYLDEQMFRFNNRLNTSDADRFSKALSQVVNRRLTYAEVTGKVGETSNFRRIGFENRAHGRVECVVLGRRSH
jgi:hypothetical protein